jgi:hypothetical protein
MGSLKREALFGVMTGVSRGRVKGPICQVSGVGLAAARRVIVRTAVLARAKLGIRIRR